MRRNSLIFTTALVLSLGAAVALFVAFHHGDAPSPTGAPPPMGTEAPPQVHFNFNLTSVKPIATGKKKAVHASAKAAAGRIQQTLDRLYLTAFLDPAAWENGRYGDAWHLFTHDALPTAQRDAGTLTLGSRAGSVYESVQPHAGRLAVQVLMDRLGHPSTAVAIVAFTARAMEQNGTPSVIESSGQYFLRPSPNGWSIYGYQVSRGDGGATAARGAP